MLAFYMDESADQKQQRVFSVSGIIADTAVWIDVEQAWETRVHRDGLEYFRTTDYVAMTGEFQKLADKYGLMTARILADAMVRDLKNVLKAHHVGLFCLGCPMVDYRDVSREPKPWIVLDKDPYMLVHEELIYRVANMMCSHTPPEPVAFIFDENDKGSAFNAIHWADLKTRVYPAPVASCMVTLAPRDDRTCPALQTADLIAHTARRAFEKQLGKRRVEGKPRIQYGDLEDMAEWRDHLAYMALLHAEYLREAVSVAWDVATYGEWEPSLLREIEKADDDKSES